MRPKVVAVILFLAIGGLGIADLIFRVFERRAGGVVPEKPPVSKTESATPAPPTVVNDKAPTVVKPVIQETNPANRDPGYAQERVAELISLSMNNDSKSLDTIWAELSNPNKEIRAGALEAVVQFGDRSVIMRLRELATQTEDPAEKASILAAADYLNLPTLDELPAMLKAAGTASALPGSGGINRNPNSRTHP